MRRQRISSTQPASKPRKVVTHKAKPAARPGLLERIAAPFTKAYKALPPVNRKIRDQASKQFGKEITGLYVEAVEASAGWPMAWRQALIGSLPAAADFTDQAKRAQAFRARIGEVIAITGRARATAKSLYGLGMHDPDAALESAAKADPKHWQQIQELVTEHIVKRSPAKTVSADLLEALATQQDALAIDTAIVDRPPASGHTPCGHMWMPIIKKLRHEFQARQPAPTAVQ